MKRILLTIAAIAMFAAPVNAQYVSLWADEGMDECAIWNDTNGAVISFYVFVMPDSRGMYAVELRLEKPSDDILSYGEPEYNEAAEINLISGSWFGDEMKVAVATCLYEPTWLVKHNMKAYTLDPGWFQMFPTAGDVPQENINFACCLEGRPKITAVAFNKLGYNVDCVIGTEESSWGAIKSMMD